MMNDIRENEFWGNREEHHGEMDEWKSENARMMEWKENGMRMMWDEWKMNMRGDERDADEMMREDMECG